jgi:hypothetical protein
VEYLVLQEQHNINKEGGVSSPSLLNPLDLLQRLFIQGG